MSKIAAALGESYQAKREELRIRKFDLGGHTFKVRVPVVAETDAIFKRINEPDETRVQELFDKLAKPLLEHKDEAKTSGFEFVDGDILIEGKSTRQTVRTQVMTQTRITEFIKLLVPVEGTMADITYEDIEAEFPMSTQLALVEKIAEVISPTYRESRGN
jgi:excinuclease UvrABC ATPase subunit